MNTWAPHALAAIALVAAGGVAEKTFITLMFGIAAGLQIGLAIEKFMNAKERPS